MKNLPCLPFKKNRYFTGKLLTADDFEQEQKYLDDKRRLINRWILGVGIAAGLEVIRVDDYNISVEMGLALDHTGREIVVDMPVIRKLSQIDGYEEATAREGAEELYLYLEYDRIPAEPVHNITNRSLHPNKEEEYSKYKESYHLYVSDTEPEWNQTDSTPASGPQAVYERAEQIRREQYRQGVCLARIELIRSGEFYMIEKVLPLPEQAFLYALPVTAGMLPEVWQSAQMIKDGSGLQSEGQAPAVSSSGNREEAWQDWQFAQGQVKIPVPPAAKAGACLFSEEIAHGLGLGDVELVLHVIGKGGSYTGRADIFSGQEERVETAARLDLNMGTFVIGIRLLEHRGEDIRIGWTAIRKISRNEFADAEPRIYIHPGLMNMKTRETGHLEAVCVNLDAADLVWQVLDPDGGSIDPDGTYHAPNRSGVYEVRCVKKNQEQIRASVFIVVRE